MIIRTNLTRYEVAHRVTELIRDFYLGNSLDQTIGLTADGRVDCGLECHDNGDVVIPFYRTQDRSLGDGDFDNPDFWTDDTVGAMASMFAGAWYPDVDRTADEIGEFDGIEIEYAQPTNQRIFIGDDEYPVDTLEQIEIAQQALREAGISETPVFAGDPPDQIKLHFVLCAK